MDDEAEDLVKVLQDVLDVLEERGGWLLSGFWSCSQGFGVKIGNLKSRLKRVLLNQKLKKGLCYSFFMVFVQVFEEKKIANFSHSSLW